MLVERPRRAADAAGRTFAREAGLLARRRGERAEALARLQTRMARAYDERLQTRSAQLFSAWQLLGAMSYRGVLARGFALVRDEAQRPLRRAEEVRQAQRLEIEFADGKVGAIAGGRVGPAMTPPALFRAGGQNRTKARRGRERCSDRRQARSSAKCARGGRRQRPLGPGEATGSAFPVAGVAGITQMFAALRRSDSTNSSGA